MARKIDIRFVIVGMLALALLGWFLAGVHWAEVGAVFREASWGWVALSALLLYLEYPLRAWRWYYLVGDVDPDIRYRDLLSATNIGGTFNTFIPLRGGDLVRIAVVARKRELPFTTVLSTTVVERLFDAFGVVGALLVLLWVLPAEVAEGGTISKLQNIGIWFGGGAFVLLILTLMLGTRGAQNVVERWLQPLPDSIRERVIEQFKALVAGLAAVGNPARLVGALFTTVFIWVNGYFGVICAFRGFHLQLPDISALFLSTAVILSVAVPQAPGFVGLFHVVLEEALGLWGASAGASEAMALAMWGLYFVPVTVAGAIDMLREGHGLTSYREELFDSLDEREKTSEVDDSDQA